MRGLRLFGRNESGATAIEYGLIVALITITAILSVTDVGSRISTVFTDVSNTLPAPAPAPAAN